MKKPKELEVKINSINITIVANGENVELTPEQEKQIKNYLGIKDNKRWKPNHKETYYFIRSDGDISSAFWSNYCDVDADTFAMGNCFKTKEDAELALKKHAVYQELKQFADENNEPIDWKNERQKKYAIYYDYSNSGLAITDYHHMMHIGTIYFSSVELAQRALTKVGEKKIEKYLFGVE